MVLGLAKWAYSLGAQHERTRIASELRERAANYHHNYQVTTTAAVEGNFKKRDKEKMERRATLFNEVENLINSLFHGEVYHTSSFLFPDDNIEKELNK